MTRELSPVAPHWWVFTPEFSYIVPIMDDGSGPTEHIRDQVCVDAPNKREAVSVGVKLMLAKNMQYVEDQRSDGLCPYTGVRAETAICPHGRCMCDCDRMATDCEACCEEAWERTEERTFK